MSLSVTSAPSALAVLQAMSPPASSPQASSARTIDGAASAAAQSSSVTTATGAHSLFAMADGVSQALTVADAADAAGQGVLGLLQQMHAAAGQALDPSTPTEERGRLDQQFKGSLGRIAPLLSSATVNGANLVDGSLSSGLKVALGGGATASLTPVDLTLGGTTLGLSPDASIATAEGAASAFASLGEAVGSASAGLSTLQTQADQIGAHSSFVQALGQALGSPALASPDQDGGDSVRLMALQVSQQLSAQPTAIANQSPQAILSLFRS